MKGRCRMASREVESRGLLNATVLTPEVAGVGLHAVPEPYILQYMNRFIGRQGVGRLNFITFGQTISQPMRTLLLTVGLFVISVASGAENINIKNLNIEDGLSSNYIVSITQDDRGFVWVATESGLNRFDGRNFRVFRKDAAGSGAATGLSGNELNKVYADRFDPLVWVATQRAGLNVFDTGSETWTVYRATGQEGSLSTDDVTDICNTSDGNLLVATYYQGVNRLDKKTGRFTYINMETTPGLPGQSVWSVRCGADGTVYIGHVDHGLSVLSPDGKLKNYRHDPNDPRSIPGNSIRALHIDNNGNLWFGTDSGLALLHPETGTFTVFRHDPRRSGSLSADYIYTISQGEENTLWVGTENGGVSVLDLKQSMFLEPSGVNFTSLGEQPHGRGLSNNTVRAIYTDSFGNVWLGTYGGGVDVVSHRPVMFEVTEWSPLFPHDGGRGIGNKIAWGITVGPGNEVWVGTDGGGISVLRGGVRRAWYSRENGSLTDDAILAAMRTSDRRLWFGTFQSGVNIFDPATGAFDAPADLSDLPPVRCIYEDRFGTVWIGTNIGIYKATLRGRLVERLLQGAVPLPENDVRAVCEDGEGNFWIGTFGQGLTVLSPDMKTLSEFNVRTGFNSNTVNSIMRDREGRMWVGMGEGLALFSASGRPRLLRIFNERDGMANSHVRAIAEDDSGAIWVSTIGGICRILPDEGKVFSYDRHYGVPSGDFMSGSVAVLDDGTIYFGSQNGLCRFDPSVVPATVVPPRTTITSFRIFGDSPRTAADGSVAPAREMKLTHRDNTFGISFNVMDMALTGMVEYAFRLKGFDDKWYMTGVDENSVVFRNIPPGKYIFEVRTRLRNQQWEEDPVTMAIRIDPPLWLMWWAKALYVIIVVISVFTFVMFFRRKIELENNLLIERNNHVKDQQLNDERLRFFTNVTHELRTPLTLILGPLEDLHSENDLQDHQRSRVNVIYKSANRLLALINQILEFRRTETQNRKLSVIRGDIAPLIRDTAVKYRALNKKGNLEVETSIESGDTVMWFDPEIITIILDNLISNAVKYTESGRIDIIYRDVMDEGTVFAEIEVSDTGKGIPSESIPKIFDRYYQVDRKHQFSGTGIGLALVQNLVNIHEGFIDVDSDPGKGTTFKVRFIKDNDYPGVARRETSEPTVEESLHGKDAETVEKRNIILVAEDEKEIRDYICESLSSKYTVYAAADGTVAREAAYRYIPDIIISDIMMPGTDGIKLCRELKRDVRTSHIPVILLTARDTIHDKTEGYEAGADSYITKPFSANLLKSRIGNILETRRRLAENVRNSDAGPSVAASDTLGELDREFIMKMTSIIEKNIDSELMDVNYIAEAMFMSHSTLYRKVKALTGLSANEFVRKVRIRKAGEMLAQGRYNVSEVSYMVGINSIKYFRQCFRDEYGCSPFEYLRNRNSAGAEKGV